MLDALLKSKFYSKCKSDIKLIRTRIEIIMRKRNATQKYLRNDVADLLKNGLDYNAYGRAEGLLAEVYRSQCYELIDQFCELILKHLSAMDKQKECPEECREAASSLMFAAARFADLPELRELRTMFSERYGKSLDYYVNKQLEEKLKSGLPSKDMKLQLMQEVAAESGLEWNSKALENKLFTESAYNKNIAKETTDNDGSVQKEGSRGIKYEFFSPREVNPERKKDLPQNQQKEAPRNEDRLSRKKESAPPPINNVGAVVKDIQVDTIGKMAKPREPALVRKTAKEEDEEKPLKHRWITPPYTKPEANKSKDKVELTKSSDTEENHNQDNPPLQAKPMGKSVRTRSLKPPSPAQNIGGSEGDEREKVNKEKAAMGQRILKFFDGGAPARDRRDHRDQRDEEEKMLDRLLQRYSGRKEAHKEGKMESAANPIPQQASADSDKAGKNRSRTNRVSSLPAESSGNIETSKTHTRAASFHPDGQAHVHPKLPDYDDFVARLAAYRGK